MKFSKGQYIKKFGSFSLVITIIFLFLIGYSSYLQVFNQDTYLKEAQVNTIKQHKIPAPRGMIYDRNGIVLATSYYQNDLYLIPHYFRDNVELLCNDLHLNCDDVRNIIKKNKSGRSFITSDISDDLAMRYQDVPGVIIIRYARRQYDIHDAPHVIGYVGRIGKSMLDDNEDEIYANDDLVGQTGIEYVYDHDLHGINGAEQYVMRADGTELLSPNKFLPKDKVIIDPVYGKHIGLNIDSRIQKVFADELKDKIGAAVMIDIHTGAILGLYSSPGYDPAHIRNSFSDPKHPLINRTLRGYAPGSTFKLITALAALEIGISPDTKFICTGYYSFAGRVYHCWKHGKSGNGHGKIDLRNAIKGSCDIYFYQLAQKVGLANIVKYARMLGLGQPTGIDLDNEFAGRLPSIRHATGGTLLNSVIGQGVIEVSPIQLANAYAVIINGGIVYEPRLVKDKPIIMQQSSFKAENVLFLLDAMNAVVNEENGTAYYSRIPDIAAGGKTGTAQHAALDKTKIKDDGLFVGYYPNIDPEIVVSVVVENGEHGSLVAPIAFKAMKEYKDASINN